MGLESTEIPKSWCSTKLSDVFEVLGGGTPSTDKSEYWNGEYPWVTSADIEGVREINIRRYITKKGVEKSTTNLVPAGSILVVTRVGLGKVAIAEELICFSQDVQALIASEKNISQKYTLYLLAYELQVLKFQGRGTTISGLTKKQIKDLSFPLPPLNEQHRIVTKIEELFSELDKGIESLKTVREQLKVYRQSLLKHAFEGKLTEQWRADNADKLETADELLARIHQEREARYQQQLEDWKKAVKEWEEINKVGKSPPRPKKPTPVNVHEANKSELPEGWKRVSLEALLAFGPINGWSPKAIDEPTSTKAITLTATTSGKFDGTKYKYIDTEIPKHSSLWLKHNDILVQRGNTIEYVGVPCLYSGKDNQFIYPDLMMKIQTADSASSQYVVSYMGTMEARNYLRSRAVGAAGSMPKINQQTLSSLPIPLCSVAEQTKIIEILDERVSICDSCSDYIDEQLKKIESLRQSILKRAFSGQLVPQDPNDEPASELLKRIAEEKAQMEATAKAAKAATRKPKMKAAKKTAVKKKVKTQ
ncbi:restriction endonuclease subunit S [Teredinibacter turnerae]|uniref:restriction endonuclease subunit S n=1 Tax=Teredinibacter turnerae TaxID=2426 RepID=UPI000368A39A|nr:restriction endonuclease subunit S [Teredinibacter turnerae]